VRLLLGCGLLLATAVAQGQCLTTLGVGQSITAPAPLPGEGVTTSICIDVPADTERLTLRLQASNAAQDLDLFVRVGTPFHDSATENIANLTADDLFERSHYYSASSGGDEFIVISRASKQPLRAGRLYLAALNFETVPVGFSISSTASSGSSFAPLEVTFTDPGFSDDVCDLSGWNDPSPRTPVRGNSGTTLGEQRRNGVIEAVRLISEQLRPSAPIRVQACWDTFPFSSNGGVLASAGPRFVILDDPGRGIASPYLDNRHTLHFSPTAGHQAGTTLCRYLGGDCGTAPADIRATFNLAVDNASNTNQRYDYGITPPTGDSSNPSFVAVALHELTHGMGFVGLIGLGSNANEQIGARIPLFGLEYDDTYGRFARILFSGVNSNQLVEFLRASTQQRAEALGSGTQLRFQSPTSVDSLENVFRANIPPLNTPQLNAPTPISTGSSYSHLSSRHTNQLMVPNATSPAVRSLGLAGDMLRDMGFNPAAKAVPQFPAPLDVQYFDVARNGHGIDFRRVAGTSDLYFLGFYSFDAAGNPEWYTSLGRVIDGVFVPQRNSWGDSLLRFDYQPGPPPVSQADTSPTFNGQVRIDFVEARRSPICLQQAAGRVLTGTLALMNWTINGEERQWCMQPLVDPNAALALDLSSVWFDPADAGWGITVQSFPGSGGDGIAIGVYYPDASGKGRWGVVQTTNFDPNQTYTVRQVQGYCRGPGCPTPSPLTFVDIGTLKIDLKPPAEGPSTLTLDVTYPGAEGGRFQRTGTVLTPVNSPRFRGN
jgi:hypothetical protein